ncbi:phage tail protein [Xenorhabdus sp. XENO-10]|uniref:Phage tail protein n=1 Tax=Xenorhabdus yunnanensis TaxID=3025878 RepID=A0ABT5LDM0_9GAMM|nr:phage tail protein [Xenorhabdus yunnanensis]MDC9589174.1 phage tail protein [Xenorhabdus yunnanensis]
MAEFTERLKRLALPSWMDKGEPAKLLSAARTFWAQVYDWLTWPLAQLDAETCTEPLLSVLAYQRDIQRFNGEPLPLFRKRVKYAFINAKDAGSIAGFIAIFERLGVGYVELLERQPDIDWDVIILRLSDGQIAANPDLLMNIIRQYGRTCRRYRFEVIAKNQLLMRVGSIGADYCAYAAAIPTQLLLLKVGHIAGVAVCDSASLKESTAPNVTYGASL